MNIPTYFTLLRIVLIPIFVVVFYIPVTWSHYVCSLIFIVAALTDWLDGFLARYLQQSSALGRFLDPVADKLVVAVALVLLVSEPELPFLTIPAAVIIGREIIISALREWMAEIGKRTSVAVSLIGKLKTTLQMIALAMLLAYQPGEPVWLIVAGYVFLYLSVCLTLWSMTVYLRTAWPDLTAK